MPSRLKSIGKRDHPVLSQWRRGRRLQLTGKQSASDMVRERLSKLEHALVLEERRNRREAGASWCKCCERRFAFTILSYNKTGTLNGGFSNGGPLLVCSSKRSQQESARCVGTLFRETR